jgi:hypothetical protein
VKKIRKRITYANVMSSIAVFLVLGGASAYAAKKIGSNEIKGNSITTGKIKKNAVTASKIKKNSITTAKIANGAVTGAKLNLGTVGTVPNATHANTADTANVANSVVGRVPVSVFTGTGTRDLAKVGPFTVQGVCRINNGGTDEGELQLLTSENGAAMDDNNGDEFDVFNISDNPAFLYENDVNTGEPEIEIAEEPGLIAVAPGGTAIVTQNESIGFNIAGHPGQCYFGTMVEKIGG